MTLHGMSMALIFFQTPPKYVVYSSHAVGNISLMPQREAAVSFSWVLLDYEGRQSQSKMPIAKFGLSPD